VTSLSRHVSGGNRRDVSIAGVVVVALLGGCVPGVSLDQLEGGNSTDAETADGDGLPPDATEADAADAGDTPVPIDDGGGRDDASAADDGRDDSVLPDDAVADDSGGDSPADDGGRPEEICAGRNPEGSGLHWGDECAGGLGYWFLCSFNGWYWCYPRCGPARECPPGGSCLDGWDRDDRMVSYCVLDTGYVNCACPTDWTSWFT
jgi:hypothetical protein